MGFVIIDVLALVLIVAGIYLVIRRPGASASSPGGQGLPGTYARRIGGTMLAAFGLAIGVIVTAFHFASTS